MRGAPSASTLLRDRYRLEQEIGRGGAAVVYRALDTKTSRPVALKVMRDDVELRGLSAARFDRELLAISRISHPHVVRVLDVGRTEDGRPCLVMELAEGPTLARALSDGAALPVRHAVAIGRQLAGALVAVHAAGVVHRDVKPSNVALAWPHEGGDPYVKLLDFGIARMVSGADELTTLTHGEVLGTPTYVSPEQARGEPAEAPADVYALGALLYHVLTGRPPFEAATPMGLLYRHVNEVPRPPSALDPQIPAWLDAQILEMLAKAPADRPSARAVHQALDQRSSAALLSPDATEPDLEVFRPSRRRLLRRTAAALGAGVAVVVAVVVATTSGGETPGPTPPTSSSARVLTGLTTPAAAPRAAQPRSPREPAATPADLGAAGQPQPIPPAADPGAAAPATPSNVPPAKADPGRRSARTGPGEHPRDSASTPASTRAAEPEPTPTERVEPSPTPDGSQEGTPPSWPRAERLDSKRLIRSR